MALSVGSVLWQLAGIRGSQQQNNLGCGAPEEPERADVAPECSGTIEPTLTLGITACKAIAKSASKIMHFLLIFNLLTSGGKRLLASLHMTY